MIGTADPRDIQLRSLANLLLLEARLRQTATVAELGYALTNDIRIIVPFDLAVLWVDTDGCGRVETVSGLPEPTSTAPFTDFAGRLSRWLARERLPPGQPAKAARRVEPDAVPATLSESWGEFLAPEVMWVPLTTAHDQTVGGLLLARHQPWADEELRVLARIAEAGALALLVLAAGGRWRIGRKRGWRTWMMVATLAALSMLALPVRLSILAPAEVVAETPLLVRAPLDGIVGKVLVKPNQMVRAGEPLFRLDDQLLKTRLAEAQQEMEVTKAEYRQAQQGAGFDAQASARMPVLAAQITQKRAEVDYIQALLERIEVRAAADGIVILPDVEHLEGKPVTLGERILAVANPAAVVLEIWVPVQDTVPLKRGAAVDLFLNVEPDTPRPAVLRDMDYQAQTTSGDLLAYRATAAFTGNDPPPRIGLRGTARIFGQRVSLFFYLFRRPWATVRPWLQW